MSKKNFTFSPWSGMLGGAWNKLIQSKDKKSKGKKGEVEEVSLPLFAMGGNLVNVDGLTGPQNFDKNMQQRMVNAKNLSESPVISAILDMYADDATSPNTYGRIMWAESTDKKIQERTDLWLKKNMVEELLWEHVRSLCTYGRFFIASDEAFSREAAGAGGLKIRLDANKVEKPFNWYPRYYNDPGCLVALYKKGLLAGFKKIPNKESTPNSMTMFGFSTAPNQISEDVVIFPPSAYLSFCLNFMLSKESLYLQTEEGEEEYQFEMGTPLLEAAFEPTQALSLLEASLLMSALTKALATRIISIEVGNMSRLEAQQKLAEIKQLFTQHISLSTGTGETESYANPGPAENVVYLTTANGLGAVTIQTMGGDFNIKDLAPLDHFRSQQMAATAVPMEFVNYHVNEGFNASGQTVAQKSSRYLRRVQRIQEVITRGWERGINLWYERNGLKGYVGKFKLRMNTPVSQYDMMSSEKLEAALSNAMKILELSDGLNRGSPEDIIRSVQEVLLPVIPKTASRMVDWKLKAGVEEDMGGLM